MHIFLLKQLYSNFYDAICFYKLFLIIENKNSYHHKVNTDYIELGTEQAENTKSQERQKTSLPKEWVENVDLYKPMLNKIMTTYECVKCNFVAPLVKVEQGVYYKSSDNFPSQLCFLATKI